MAESVDAPDLKSVDHYGRGGSSPPAPMVLDGFLNPGTFLEMVRHIKDVNFPWCYPNSPGEPEQYCSILYFDHQFNRSISPQLMHIMRSVTTQLNAISILKIKVNATPRNAPEQIWHTDWQISTPSKTCVLYLNDCDGYTEFRDGQRVVSKENTAVIFDTNLEHRGVPQTDLDRRLVLNITYFEK